MSTGSSPFTAPLSSALAYALEHLSPEEEMPVAATETLASLRQKLDLPLPEEETDPALVLDSLVRGVNGGILNSAGGKFFGWVIGGALPAALAADWLASAWDQNAAMFACAPAAAVVEETSGRWLKELLRIRQSASFALVTGCQMAHVTCLAAARHALLAKLDWDVEQKGLAGSPAIRVLCSTEKHGSLVRAVRLLGIGEGNIQSLAVDSQGRLLEDALAQALQQEPGRPTVLVLQAGDLNIGAYDNFNKLIPLAKSLGAWTHIDGAFGLWAAASPRFESLLEGAELADSWATDGHKWLNVPYDCGYAFVADREAHRGSLSHKASYLTHNDAARDQLDWNPEWSRRARGFATYAALRQLGRRGITQLIDRTCDHARALTTGIGALPGAELVWEPTINQGLVRFLHPSRNAAESDHDAFTDRIMADILDTGEAFFTGTTWRGRRAMRISVCNWQTSTGDVARVIDCVAAVLKQACEPSSSAQASIAREQPALG